MRIFPDFLAHKSNDDYWIQAFRFSRDNGHFGALRWRIPAKYEILALSIIATLLEIYTAINGSRFDFTFFLSTIFVPTILMLFKVAPEFW